MSAKPLRVAMLHWFTNPLNLEHVGGVVRVELSQLQEMRTRGVDVKLYGRKVRGHAQYVYALNDYQYLGKLQLRASLMEFMVRESKSDIWHCANISTLAWLNPKKTLVYFSNNADSVPLLAYEQRYKRYQKAFYAFCSQFTKDDFHNRYPDISEDHCFLIHQGVDVEYFQPPMDRPSKYDGIKRLFFLNQWSQEKGVWVLLKAIAILNKLRPQKDFRWVIGGSSRYWGIDPNDENRIKNAMQLVSKEFDNVEIIGDVKYSEYPGILKTMDIQVNPVVWQEPFGLVNVEAMAAGLPVIASAVGGIPEIVRSEINGLLIPPTNPEALARAINRLLDTPKLVEAMSIAARKTVVDSFTWQQHGEALLNVYRQIIGR